MGITVFDLFNEIITGEDMKRFLKDQKIKEEYFGAGLVLRTFLQMVELSPKSVSTNLESDPEIVDNCQIKIEESDSYDEMIGFSDQELNF